MTKATFQIDEVLLQRARGLVKANKRLRLAWLVNEGLAHIVKRYERKGTKTAYRGKPIRLPAGRKKLIAG